MSEKHEVDQTAAERHAAIVENHFEMMENGFQYPPEKSRILRLVSRLDEFQRLKREAVEREDFEAAVRYRDECQRLIQKLKQRGISFPDIVTGDGKIILEGWELGDPLP